MSDSSWMRGRWMWGSAAAPSVDAVAELARRLVAMAGEMDALRRRLGAVSQVDWNSVAAAAFREELEERVRAMSHAVQALDSAAAKVTSYAIHLSSAEPSGPAPAIPAPLAHWRR